MKFTLLNPNMTGDKHFELMPDSIDDALNVAKLMKWSCEQQQAHDFQQFAAWLRQRGLDHTAEVLEAAAKEATDA